MNDNPTQSLALLSGKGGAGKTILALSISQLLKAAGFKVLLVDCDLATHGATYFFESELDENDQNNLTFFDILNQDTAEWRDTKSPLKTTFGFDFIPSNVIFNDNPPNPDTFLVDTINFRLGNLSYTSLLKKYDIVIFDCQAGYSPLSRAIVDYSNKILIVLEPDAISSTSLRVLHLQLGNILKSSKTFQIYNKLIEEELPIYTKVQGGALFKNLPPIPFDWEVRASFSLGQIPDVTTRNMTFGLAVIRILALLFPKSSKEINNYKKNEIDDWYIRITNTLNDLKLKKKEIDTELSFYKRNTKMRRNRMLSALIVAIGILTTSISLPNIWFIKELMPSEIKDVSDLPITALFGIIIMALGGFYYFRILAERRDELKLDRLRQVTSEIESEMKRYNVLLKTSPDYQNRIELFEDQPLNLDISNNKNIRIEEIQYEILKAISEYRAEVTIATIIDGLDLPRTEAGYHIDILRKYDFIRFGGHLDSGESWYFVTPMGREYLMKIKKNMTN